MIPPFKLLKELTTKEIIQWSRKTRTKKKTWKSESKAKIIRAPSVKGLIGSPEALSYLFPGNTDHNQ